jgi:hypothetical protein
MQVIAVSDKPNKWEVIFTAIIIPVVLALSHDITRPYAITPDADLIYLGQALRLGDGLEQTYFDHTGHAYILVLYAWLKLCAILGAIPMPSEAAAVASENIDRFIQPLVVVGRGLSVLISCGFVFLMMRGAQWLRLSRLMVIAVGLIFATTIGLTHHSLIIRAEALSAFGVFVAFFSLVRSQQVSGWSHVGFLVLAGASVLISLDAKIQAIIVILALPVIALALGMYRSAGPVRLEGHLALTFQLFASAVSLAFVSVVSFSLLAKWGETSGYQFIIVGLVAICIATYGWVYREPLVRQMTGLLSLMTGMSFGAALLFIWHDHRLLDSIVHFIEHMKQFSVSPSGNLLSDAVLADLVPKIISRHFAEMFSPIIFLEVVAVICLVVLIWRRDWQRAFLVILLLGLSLAVEAAFGLRYYALRYQIYAVPWLILSVAIALDAVYPWKAVGRKLVFSAGVLVMTVIFSMQSLGPSTVPRQPSQNVCIQAYIYLEPALHKRFNSYCTEKFLSDRRT